MVGELFASIRNEPASFFPLPACFELYGIDFLLDSSSQVKLLEINGLPDLTHLGTRFFDHGVSLYDSIFRLAIDPLADVDRSQPANLRFQVPVDLSPDLQTLWTVVYHHRRDFTF